MSPDANELRLVSVLPAATEIIYALGAGGHLVGASHECDHPEAAKKLPRVSQPRIDPTLPSRELDAAVKHQKRRGESLYKLDEKLLARLRPTHIFTQVECDVCAITPKDLEAATKSLSEKPKIIALDGQSLTGVLDDVRRLGEVLGRGEEARLVLFRQWRLIKEIRGRVRGLKRRRVAVLDWVDPPMLAGHWIPELVDIAGGDYTLVKAGAPSRWTSWEEIEEYEPDVIVVAPCGRDPETTRRDLRASLLHIAPGDLSAQDEGQIWIADGNHFFNRPGPRLVYSAALLARAIHRGEVPPLPPILEKEIQAFAP